MSGHYIDIAYACAAIIIIGLISIFVANIIEERDDHKRGKWGMK